MTEKRVRLLLTESHYGDDELYRKQDLKRERLKTGSVRVVERG